MKSQQHKNPTVLRLLARSQLVSTTDQTENKSQLLLKPDLLRTGTNRKQLESSGTTDQSRLVIMIIIIIIIKRFTNDNYQRQGLCGRDSSKTKK